MAFCTKASLARTNARTAKRFNPASQQLRSLLYLRRSESLNPVPPTSAQADAARNHGGSRWRNRSV